MTPAAAPCTLPRPGTESRECERVQRRLAGKRLLMHCCDVLLCPCNLNQCDGRRKKAAQSRMVGLTHLVRIVAVYFESLQALAVLVPPRAGSNPDGPSEGPSPRRGTVLCCERGTVLCCIVSQQRDPVSSLAMTAAFQGCLQAGQLAPLRYGIPVRTDELMAYRCQGGVRAMVCGRVELAAGSLPPCVYNMAHMAHLAVCWWWWGGGGRCHSMTVSHVGLLGQDVTMIITNDHIAYTSG